MVTSTESLERLVRILDFDLGAVDESASFESASIMRVMTNGEIGMRSLDGEHPFDALLGFVCPDDWEIFGVIAPGWGTYYAGPRKGERRRMRAIHVVSRSGEEVSLLHFAGEEPSVTDGARVPGRVADCIRRALDVPTEAATEASLLPVWFDRVLQRLVARNHPSFEGALVGVDEIHDFIGERPTSWSDERWRTVMAGGNEWMDGELAAWMDDGMFCRFMLGEMTDPEVSLTAAKRVCTPEAWTELLTFFAAEAPEDDEPL